MNDFEVLHKICKSRKSTRQFLPDEIPPSDIEKMLELAYTAPYASGRKNWEINAITSKDVIAQMAQVVQKHTQQTAQQMDEEVRNGFLQYASNFSFFEHAPLVFVPTYRVQPIMNFMMNNKATGRQLEWERDNYTKSVSCVASLLLLAAESLGYGACYMTGPLLAQEELLPLVTTKKGREIGAIIPVGLKKI